MAGSFFHKGDSRFCFFRSLPRTGKILELGCGRGENCKAIRHIAPDLELHGIDLLDADQVPDIIQYQQINLENLPLPYPDASFDAILFVHVIEHLKDPFILASEINRLLKPGGRFYVETPNYTSIFVPSFSYKRSQHHPFNFWDDPGHVHPWTKQSIYEFILKCGLTPQKLSTTRNWLKVPFDPFGIIYGFLTGNRPRMVRHFWNLYGWCIYTIGRKDA